jgi:hypothetical protein
MLLGLRLHERGFWVVALAVTALPATLVCPTVLSAEDAEVEFDYLPRVTGTNDAARRINGYFEKEDADAEAFRDDCLTEPGAFFERGVEVTFDGPRFLSVVESVGYYCNDTAHPWTYVSPVTFDRATGLPVDWQGLLSIVPEPVPGNRALKLPAEMHEAFLAGIAPIPTECVEALSKATMPFFLWLDGKRSALAVRPAGLAHVDTPCEDTAYLSADLLSAFGVDPALLAGLAASSP